MITAAEILDRLREFVSSQFPVARNLELTADQPLLTSGIIDSMGTLEVVTFIETEFGIVLTDEEMLDGNFETLQKMADFVSAKIETNELEAAQV